MEHLHAFQCVEGLIKLGFCTCQRTLCRSRVDRSYQLSALDPLAFADKNTVECSHAGETYGCGRLFFHLPHIDGTGFIHGTFGGFCRNFKTTHLFLFFAIGATG